MFLSVPLNLWIAVVASQVFTMLALLFLSGKRYSKTGFWIRWIVVNVLAIGVFMFCATQSVYSQQNNMSSVLGYVVQVDNSEIEIRKSDTGWKKSYKLSEMARVTFDKGLPRRFEAKLSEVDNLSDILRAHYKVLLLIDRNTRKVKQIKVKEMPR